MMYLRIPLLKAILDVLNNIMIRLLVWRTMVVDLISAITNRKVMVFTRGGDLNRLHAAFNYIHHNESSRIIVVIHLFSGPDDDESEAIQKSLEILGRIFMNYEIEFHSCRGSFGPDMIQTLSRKYNVAVNNISSVPRRKSTIFPSRNWEACGSFFKRPVLRKLICPAGPDPCRAIARLRNRPQSPLLRQHQERTDLSSTSFLRYSDGEIFSFS